MNDQHEEYIACPICRSLRTFDLQELSAYCGGTVNPQHQPLWFDDDDPPYLAIKCPRCGELLEGYVHDLSGDLIFDLCKCSGVGYQMQDDGRLYERGPAVSGEEVRRA